MPVTVFSKPTQFLILKIVTLNVLMPAFSTLFSKCVVPDSENWDSKCSHTGIFSTVFSKCSVISLSSNQWFIFTSTSTFTFTFTSSSLLLPFCHHHHDLKVKVKCWFKGCRLLQGHFYFHFFYFTFIFSIPPSLCQHHHYLKSESKM